MGSFGSVPDQQHPGRTVLSRKYVFEPCQKKGVVHFLVCVAVFASLSLRYRSKSFAAPGVMSRIERSAPKNSIRLRRACPSGQNIPPTQEHRELPRFQRLLLLGSRPNLSAIPGHTADTTRTNGKLRQDVCIVAASARCMPERSRGW